ncbi:MAG: TonB-dependent receptor [Bacteroidales bacterium]|nr:TonB-dependent receptor [Bacteroidales bacterium]
MKSIVIVLIIGLLPYAVFAQNQVSGKITDETGAPMPGTTIFIPESNKGTVSDINGFYVLSGLSNGKLKIQYSYLGYNNFIETVVLNNSSAEVNVQLRPTPIETEEIVVTGGYSSSQHENVVKIDKLKLNQITNRTTPNFMELISTVPGVDMISKGPGVSKPVIRGLSMNDILVLSNGVRFENYQYSDHHPLGIDEFGIENVEIIKGPASLIYGSDAIGGVINFIKEKPAPVGRIIGDYNLQLFSNTEGINNNLGIRGTSKKFFGGFRVGQKSHADYLQGGGEVVPNSRFNELSFKANGGYTGKLGTFKLYYDYNDQKLGLVEDEALELVTGRGRKNEVFYQQFKNHLISSQNKLFLGNSKLELNASYQNTTLTHFADIGEVEIEMQLATINYEAKYYFPSSKSSEYILGFQGMNQKNTNINDRETILLPDADTDNYSLFGLVSHTVFQKLKIQAGLRYDFRIITSDTYGEAEDINYHLAISRDYGSFSGSAGATYSFFEKWLLRANFAAAYRTPNLAELTSHGKHETRFEEGNPDLVPQNAYESDLSTHFHSDNITFDVAGYYNIINHYIFISPTDEYTEDGDRIYRYQQSNALLYGGEAGIHVHPQPVEWLHIEGTYSKVVGEQSGGDYLPFVPADKLNFEFRAEQENLSFLKKPFFRFDWLLALDQEKPAPDEERTGGYALFDVGIGFHLKAANQLLAFGFSVNNIFDRKYFDHLSTLKEVNYFEPGRNFTFNLRVPFGIK